jgi:uncharacterized protein
MPGRAGTMASAMEREQVVETLRRYFAGRDDVVAAYLFGSAARGTARPSSDVDVGVVLRAGRPRDLHAYGRLVDVQADLEERMHCAVDVVPMNGAPPDLLHRILRDGVCVHDSDPAARVAFELQARNEYFDLLPVLVRYRQTVLGSA